MSVAAIQVAKRLLRDLGVMSLEPSAPMGQVTEIERGDTDDVAMVMSAALQEVWSVQPAYLRQRPDSFFLNPPTSVTLTVSEGSKTTASFSTWAAWMEGCTIRIAGDEQDNELVSATSLARHYAGTSGSVGATVYGDSAVLDSSISEIAEPVFVASPVGYWPLTRANSASEFAISGNWPRVGDGQGMALVGLNAGFWLFTRKSIGPRPCIYFDDGLYDATLSYAKKRIRFAQMPDQKVLIGFTALLTAPRITASDIEGDSDVTLPLADNYVESLYLPICRQMLTGLTNFKNEAAKPEIARAYKKAMNDITNLKATRTTLLAEYPRP